MCYTIFTMEMMSNSLEKRINKMIGIEFKQHEVNKFLKCLFKNIDLSKYSFLFLEDELYDNENPDFREFGINDYPDDFDEFLERNYYIIFLAMQVYLKGSNIGVINNYEDFLKSTCQLIVLIVDAECFEVYFKDLDLQNQIIKNIESLNIDYKIKTVDNDTRYSMHIN